MATDDAGFFVRLHRGDIIGPLPLVHQGIMNVAITLHVWQPFTYNAPPLSSRGTEGALVPPRPGEGVLPGGVLVLLLVVMSVWVVKDDVGEVSVAVGEWRGRVSRGWRDIGTPCPPVDPGIVRVGTVGSSLQLMWWSILIRHFVWGREGVCTTTLLYMLLPMLLLLLPMLLLLLLLLLPMLRCMLHVRWWDRGDASRREHGAEAGVCQGTRHRHKAGLLFHNLLEHGQRSRVCQLSRHGRVACNWSNEYVLCRDEGGVRGEWEGPVD